MKVWPLKSVVIVRVPVMFPVGTSTGASSQPSCHRIGRHHPEKLRLVRPGKTGVRNGYFHDRAEAGMLLTKVE